MQWLHFGGTIERSIGIPVTTLFRAISESVITRVLQWPRRRCQVSRLDSRCVEAGFLCGSAGLYWAWDDLEGGGEYRGCIQVSCGREYHARPDNRQVRACPDLTNQNRTAGSRARRPTYPNEDPKGRQRRSTRSTRAQSTPPKIRAIHPPRGSATTSAMVCRGAESAVIVSNNGRTSVGW